MIYDEPLVWWFIVNHLVLLIFKEPDLQIWNKEYDIQIWNNYKIIIDFWIPLKAVQGTRIVGFNLF